MPHVVPSQIVEAISDLFAWNNLESHAGMVGHQHQGEVRTLLALLDQVPRELISLQFREYLEFERCRSVLATALPAWNLGGTQPSRVVNGHNPVEHIRRLMEMCQDQLPPPEPEFPFVEGVDARQGIEEQIRAAWINFHAGEWIGATTSAAVALEAVLLLEVKRIVALPSYQARKTKSNKSPDDMVLHDLIEAVAAEGSIGPSTAQQAHLARDARNLIHPGKVVRSGMSCSKSTALAAFAAVYRVADDLHRGFLARSQP